MENFKFTDTEKGGTGDEPGQEHAHHLFDIKEIVHKHSP
jgi:hypothetical protein